MLPTGCSRPSAGRGRRRLARPGRTTRRGAVGTRATGSGPADLEVEAATGACPRPARPPPPPSSRPSSTGRWRAMTRTGTVPTGPGPRGCHPTCASVRSTRGRCWIGCRPGRRGRSSAPSWPGGSSTPTCCGTGPIPPGPPCRRWAPTSGATPDRRPTPGSRAWAAGRTGYPLVDAGMRQLRAEGWMHNRLRMLTASFLVKDLHLPLAAWGGPLHGLRSIDGDLASNNHGWQWVAGTGTDAAPFFRVFSPERQAGRFDPDGRLRRPVRTRGRQLRTIRNRSSTTRASGPRPWSRWQEAKDAAATAGRA